MSVLVPTNMCIYGAHETSIKLIKWSLLGWGVPEAYSCNANESQLCSTGICIGQAHTDSLTGCRHGHTVASTAHHTGSGNRSKCPCLTTCYNRAWDPVLEWELGRWQCLHPSEGGAKIVTVNVCTFISDMHCVRRNQATGDRWTHQMASLQSVPVKSKPRSSMVRRKSLKKTTQCLATASCDFLTHKYRNPSSELTNNIPNMNWFYFKGYLTFCFVLVVFSINIPFTRFFGNKKHGKIGLFHLNMLGYIFYRQKTT